jgi:hypothetical protein
LVDWRFVKWWNTPCFGRPAAGRDWAIEDNGSTKQPTDQVTTKIGRKPEKSSPRPLSETADGIIAGASAIHLEGINNPGFLFRPILGNRFKRVLSGNF